LTNTGGIYFRDEKGVVLGVTFSSEDDGTWFLNLKKGRFDEAVLLCQTRADLAQVINLPRAFLDRYGRQLTLLLQSMVSRLQFEPYLTGHC
jgi:hypothetical protein